MPVEKFHFIAKKRDKSVSALAKTLISEIGQSSLEEATTIVSIGGDGILMEAFHQAGNKKVFGITPEGSNSRGFWTDHDVKNSKDLLERVEKARTFLLAPLKGTIHFSKGALKEVYAFNDIMIERPTAQSALFNLTAQFGDQTIGPQRIMTGGYIFSTAYGSTGGSRHYGGSVVAIHDDVIILTGKGITEPMGTHPVVVGMDKTHFHADFVSAETKRPVRIDYDGVSIKGSRKDGSIVALDVSGAPDHSVHFLTMNNPDVRAYSSIMPR